MGLSESELLLNGGTHGCHGWLENATAQHRRGFNLDLDVLRANPEFEDRVLFPGLMDLCV